MIEKVLQILRTKKELLVIAAFTIFYLLMRSISYDDWDSIQFALAIEQFDMALHQPHPPGYPVYIFILRIFNLIFTDPLITMTVVSAISGGVGLWAFYKFIREYGKSENQALVLMVMLGAFPLYALNSVKAMSDIVALMLYLVWLWLYIRLGKGIAGRERLYTALSLGIVSGLMLGVRIQLFVAIIIPLLVIVITEIKKLNLWRSISSQEAISGRVIAGGLIGTLSWLIPSVIASGGLIRFSELLAGQYVWRYEIHAHTPFEYGFNIPYFFTHAIAHLHTFVRGGIGISLPWHGVFDIPTWIEVTASVLLFVALIGLGKFIWNNWHNKVVQLLAISAIPYALFMYLNLNYENARYWLPLLPWFVIGVKWIIDTYLPRNAGLILIAIVIMLLALNSISLTWIVHTQKSPPTQAIELMQSKFNKEVILLNCSFMNGRHFEYIPENELQFIDDFTSDEIEQIKQSDKALYSCRCEETLDELPGSKILWKEEFYRDIRVHWKHSYVETCEVGI